MKKVIAYTIIFLFAWLIIASIASFGLGYLAGWISKIIIGKWLVMGFAVLGINININDLPLIGGVLSWISCFFISARLPEE